MDRFCRLGRDARGEAILKWQVEKSEMLKTMDLKTKRQFKKTKRM